MQPPLQNRMTRAPVCQCCSGRSLIENRCLRRRRLQTPYRDRRPVATERTSPLAVDSQCHLFNARGDPLFASIALRSGQKAGGGVIPVRAGRAPQRPPKWLPPETFCCRHRKFRQIVVPITYLSRLVRSLHTVSHGCQDRIETADASMPASHHDQQPQHNSVRCGNSYGHGRCRSHV